MMGINKNLVGSYFSIHFAASSLVAEIVHCTFSQLVNFTSGKPALPLTLPFYICKLLLLLYQVYQVLCSVMHLQLWMFRAAL